MLGLEFTGEIPFSDVYIHSIIQAPDGRRMSKSLGTGIDPRSDLIDGGQRPRSVFAGAAEEPDPGEFPAVRSRRRALGLARAMSSAQDVRFNEEKVSQAQQLTNKLWNASRLILLRVDQSARADARPQAPEDHWILARLERARAAVGEAIDSFEFSRAALTLYDFVYGELCDWYLELVKPRLYDGDPDTAATLLHVLTETVTLAHPLIPFVTEEIYGYIPGSEGLLAARFAGASASIAEASAEEEVERAIQAIQAIRAWRDAAEVKALGDIACRRRLRADGYERHQRFIWRGSAVSSSARTALLPMPLAAAKSTVVIPGGDHRDPALRRSRPRGGHAQARGQA